LFVFPTCLVQLKDIFPFIYKAPTHAMLAGFLQNRSDGRNPFQCPEGRVDLTDAALTKFGQGARSVITPIYGGGGGQ